MHFGGMLGMCSLIYFYLFVRYLVDIWEVFRDQHMQKYLRHCEHLICIVPGIAMGLLCDSCGIAVGMPWECCGNAVGLLLYCSGVVVVGLL